MNLYSLGGYPKRVIGCVFTVLHTIHMCEYGPTSRFAHLLGPFFVKRAFFGAVDVGHPLGIAIVTTL